MSGVRRCRGISSRHSAINVLFPFILVAALFAAGCAGFVQGTSSTGGGTPLVISNVTTANPALASVTVDWLTSAAANSQVEYGTTSSYGSTTAVDPTMVTSHQVALSGLAAGTTYYYQVSSTDSKGNHGKSGGHTFKTAGLSISGTISPAAGGSGTTVTLSGAANATGTADTSGNYTLTGLASGTYTVTPSRSGYTFSPASQVATVNNANVTGVNFTANAVAVAPTITTQPANQTVTAGQTATFAVAATGTSPLSYQWQKNGVNISGASASSYTTPATATSDSGSTFRVVVTNSAGTVTSSAATLTVNAAAVAPTITTQPANQTVTAGQTATFTVAATGTAPLSYQWQKNGVNIAGATATSYTTPATTTADSGATFAVVVSNTAGTVTSVTATLTVNPAPVAPSITSLNPTSGLVGASVTIAGANFGATQGTSTVKFNGISATPTSWSATSIVAPVPAGATSGNVVVTVGGVASNGASFTVTATAPSITSLNPTSGLVGASVTIAGANFGATQGTSTVKFNGVAATPTSWSATSIVAPVPAGATTGSVVVTVGGVASNGVSFTVTTDTTPPVVTITGPANNATVSGTITLTATAADPDSAVSFVQFRVDAANTGAQLTASPYSISLDTTTLSNGSHSLTAIAKDPAGNQGTSASVTITVSNATSTSMGPLKQSTVNTRYLVGPAGNAVFLAGSHTWDDFQDTDTSGSTPAAFDFNAYVNFLKTHNQNATILWRKDLPEYCGWDVSGSTWRMAPWPWLRPGPGLATDGNPKFDLTQFNQAYFDRLRAQVIQLQQNGIYAIVQLFDGNQLTSYRCSTDGYPFTGTNNVNGINDGYTSGSCGVGSMTMTTNNAITNIQDAYVKKVIDTVNDLPNVLYEIAEEQPGSSFSSCPGYGGASSMTFWAPHMFGLIKTYEAGGTWEGITYLGKPAQHPYGIGSMNYGDRAGGDTTLYGSTAVWIAPSINAGVDMFPSNVPVNNQGKVVINDSDHALGWKAMLNSDGSVKDQSLRGYIWENITQGAEAVVFMDPYEIYWPSTPTRNTCQGPVNQVCSGVDTKYNNFRTALGIAQTFVNANMDLVKATPQASLSSTGFCLADNAATGAEYLVYAPSGGTITVNLSATTRVLNVEWVNPVTGAVTSGGSVTGGNSAMSFTAPFSGDAVLYIVDAAGHN